jgi:predicted acyl esterase
MADAMEQAQYGYYTMVYSVRGEGNSTGLSNLISRTEMNDLFEIVAFVKKDSLADSTHIGLFGASQGGILPFMAVCNGLKVTMVMSDLASPEFASSWIENGSIKMTAFFSVDYDSTVARYTDEVKNIRKWMLSKEESAWDSLAYYLPRNRDFISEVKNNKVPILLSNAWQDKFFNTLGVIKASRLLTSPFLAYWGAMEGHGADTSYRQNILLSNIDSDWMEFYLNNIHHPLIDTNKFIFAASHYPVVNDAWFFSAYHSPTWTPTGVRDINFYFTPAGKLSEKPNTAVKDTLVLLNDVRDTSMTMLDAIDDEFKGVEFNTKFVKHNIVFDSDSLTADYLLAGTPKLDLHYMSDARVCQYNFQIWDVKPNNAAKLVTRINYTDRHCTPGTISNANVDGMSFSHLFKAGDHIRIILTNLDTAPADSFLLSNPHVLPVLTKSKNVLVMNRTYPSRITMPIEMLLAGTGTEALPVDGYQLTQNYPNPFTTSTRIRYMLPKQTRVTLTVYDALGRKVTDLVKEEKPAGPHIVEFNGSNYAPGIYFYTLRANEFRQTKKFTLMK